MHSKIATKENLLAQIMSNRQRIKQYGVRTLGLFGSFVRNEQTAISDIDLLVDFEPEKETFRNFINLAYYMEELLGRKVELVTQNGLSPYIGPYILKEVEYVPL
jgi:predicted nucleotidyltransferase